MLKETQIFYLPPDDVRTRNMLETTVVLVNGIHMAYVKTGRTRLQGSEFDIYELVPMSRKIATTSSFQRYMCACWWPRTKQS